MLLTELPLINKLYPRGIVENSFIGPFTKYVTLVGVGEGGVFDQESYSATRGAAQAVSRDEEAYREKFIPIYIYNKTRPCLQIYVP